MRHPFDACFVRVVKKSGEGRLGACLSIGGELALNSDTRPALEPASWWIIIP
jgi:hypothetical protein